MIRYLFNIRRTERSLTCDQHNLFLNVALLRLLILDKYYNRIISCYFIGIRKPIISSVSFIIKNYDYHYLFVNLGEWAC
jgi:hypothetical protein